MGISSFDVIEANSYIGGGTRGDSVPSINGKTWYVDVTNGQDGNSGASAQLAVKTITQALALAGNGTGDTIYVYPGSYTENVVVSKDYICLHGATLAGFGKPDIEAASGVTLTVTGQGFRAVHCRFAGVADAVRQQGNGFEYYDCVFDGDGNGATTALLRFLPSSTNTHLTASEGYVHDCLFRGSGGFGIVYDTGAAPVGVGSTDNLVQGNVFRGNTGVDIENAKTGAGGVYSGQSQVIDSNIFQDKNKATYIDLTTNADGSAGSQSGVCSRNVFASDTMTTTKIKAVGTAWTFPGNMDTVGIFDGSGLD